MAPHATRLDGASHMLSVVVHAPPNVRENVPCSLLGVMPYADLGCGVEQMHPSAGVVKVRLDFFVVFIP